MSLIWVVGVIALLAAAIVGVTMRLRRGPRRDLGAVSSHWISEYRLGSNDDYSRR
jgi:hypothetical protein